MTSVLWVSLRYICVSSSWNCQPTQTTRWFILFWVLVYVPITRTYLIIECHLYPKNLLHTIICIECLSAAVQCPLIDSSINRVSGIKTALVWLIVVLVLSVCVSSQSQARGVLGHTPSKLVHVYSNQAIWQLYRPTNNLTSKSGGVQGIQNVWLYGCCVG